jgi:glycosyltransferase involved in cell wall biosynthesis
MSEPSVPERADRPSRPAASIVIPAHNEQVALRRLLTALLAPAKDGEFEIVVVCNGCTDDTAQVAREFGPDVVVVEEPRPSKRDALKRGDELASHFPRLYIDADVELGGADVRKLVDALGRPGVLACAPSRVLPREGVSVLVSAYYDVWERLPQVQTGLFGRGVVAVNHSGFERIRDLPPVMSDDLASSLAFSATERTVVEAAHVVIRLPRTARGLLRRRIRVMTGTTQIDGMTGRSDQDKTAISDLLRIARQEPAIAPQLIVFIAMAAFAKVGARRRTRRGDFDTWLRDDSRGTDAT